MTNSKNLKLIFGLKTLLIIIFIISGITHTIYGFTIISQNENINIESASIQKTNARILGLEINEELSKIAIQQVSGFGYNNNVSAKTGTLYTALNNQAPVISISYPSNTQTFQSSSNLYNLNLQYIGSDPNGIQDIDHYEVKVDTGSWINNNLNLNYNFNLTSGSHTLYVKVFDKQGAYTLTSTTINIIYSSASQNGTSRSMASCSYLGGYDIAEGFICDSTTYSENSKCCKTIPIPKEKYPAGWNCINDNFCKTGICSSNVCIECISNLQCENTGTCITGLCAPVVSDTCGFVDNHKFNPYECCTNTDCDSSSKCSNNKCVKKSPEEIENNELMVEYKSLDETNEIVVGGKISLIVSDKYGNLITNYKLIYDDKETIVKKQPYDLYIVDKNVNIIIKKDYFESVNISLNAKTKLYLDVDFRNDILYGILSGANNLSGITIEIIDSNGKAYLIKTNNEGKFMFNTLDPRQHSTSFFTFVNDVNKGIFIPKFGNYTMNIISDTYVILTKEVTRAETTPEKNKFIYGLIIGFILVIFIIIVIIYNNKKKKRLLENHINILVDKYEI